MKQAISKKSAHNEKVVPHDIELRKLELWGKAIDHIAPFLRYLEQRLLKHDAPIAKSTVWGFIIIIILILGASFVLVMFNRLDSAGFTFVVGILLGYLLSMAKTFLKHEQD